MLERTIGLNLILWLALIGVSVRAQTSTLRFREDDERAATIQQRQDLLKDLLTRAHDDQEKGDLVGATDLLARAARLQARLHKPDEALATYRQVLTLTKNNANLFAQVDSLNGMAALSAAASQCDRAEATLDTALALTAAGSYDFGRAESLLALSDCQNRDDHEKALLTAQQALKLWQSLNSKWGMAKTYTAIGEYQLSQAELIAASESFHRSLDLWVELNIPSEQGEAWINLGFVEYRRGAWQDSILLLNRAQSLIDEGAEPFRMGQINGGIAEAFIEAGSPEAGLEKLPAATDYFRKANTPRAVIAMYWDFGRAYYMLGNYAEALKNFKAGLGEAQSLHERFFGAFCAEYLGRTYAAINETDQAMQYYRSALNEYRAASSPMEAARTTALMGQLYQSQGKVEQGRKEYQAALTEFRKLDDRLNESATLYAIATLELGQNNLDVAEDYLRQSIAATEDIRRVSTSNDLTAALSGTLQDRYDSLIDCLMRRNAAGPSSDYARRAFETSEVGRARALTEFFRATQPKAVSGVDPALAEKENSLRKELRVKEDSRVTLLATNYKREELTKLESQIAALTAEYKQVLDTLRRRDPAYEQMTQPTTWDLRRIQNQLIVDNDTMLLEFSLGTTRSYLWVVTRDGFSSYELPAGNKIVAATKTVYDLVKEPPRDKAPAFGNSVQDLTDMLLGPLDGKLRKRIIVVGDGALNYLPFQLLTVKSENGVPLASNHEIVNTPSASILGYLEEQAAHRPRREIALAAFGDPMFASSFARTENISRDLASNAGDAGRSSHALRDIELSGDKVNPNALQPLFFAGRELAMLREIAGDNSLVATGFDANTDRLKSADLTPYAILHFATHGILDPKRPENSGIFLSTIQRDGRQQNGYFSLQDIYSLRAPVDLVVLSACRTGLGKEVRGEGLIGLTRGFMYAGAASVVASLWKVDDESTSELMKRFYTNMLQRGIPPAEALRAAQNSIRSEPQWSSPYYWAAFTLQGEYRNPIRLERDKSSSKQALTIVIGLAAMVMLLWFSYRRMRNTMA